MLSVERWINLGHKILPILDIVRLQTLEQLTHICIEINSNFVEKTNTLKYVMKTMGKKELIEMNICPKQHAL